MGTNLIMNNPLRALIVEDSKFDAEFIMRALRETGYELSGSTIVDDPVEFEEALSGMAKIAPFFHSKLTLAPESFHTVVDPRPSRT